MDQFTPLLREFAEETGVFGVSLFKHTLPKIEVLFWLATVVFFCGTTGRDILKLTSTYVDKDVISIAERHENGSLVFEPAPSVFLPTESKMAKELETFSLNASSLLDELGAFYDEYALSVDNDSYLPPMDPNLLLLSQLLIQEITEYELGVTEQNDESAIATYAGQNQNYDALVQAMKIVSTYFIAKNVDLVRLQQIVGSHICRSYGLKTVHFQKATPLPVRRNADAICVPANVVNLNTVRPAGKSLAFKSTYDFFELQWKCALPYQFLLKVDYAGTIQVNSAANIDSKVPLRLQPGDRFSIFLRVLAVFEKVRDVGSRPCDKTNGYFACVEGCIANLILNCSGCFPLSYSPEYKPNDPNTSICPTKNRSRVEFDKIHTVYFPACVRESQLAEDGENMHFSYCKHECPSDCVVRSYGHTIQSTYTTAEMGKDFCGVRMHAYSFSFPLFTERLALSFDEYFSQFGGILGLYLGLSFSALIHIPVYFARKLWQWRRKQAVEEAAEKALKLTVDVAGPSGLSETVSDLQSRVWHLEAMHAASRNDKLGNDIRSRVLQLERIVAASEERQNGMPIYVKGGGGKRPQLKRMSSATQ